MAYETGTASSFADLLSKINTFLTANGWTLSGSVIHKDACYIELASGSTRISIRGGTGIDGSNNITGISSAYGRVNYAYFGKPAQNIPVVFDATYFFHVSDSPNDEFFCFLKYSSDVYINLCFGRSPSLSNSATGNWFHSVSSYYAINYDTRTVTRPFEGGSADAEPYLMPFFRWGSSFNAGETGFTSDMHASISGTTKWASESGTGGQGAMSCLPDVSPMLAASPNSSNGEPVLLPCNIWSRFFDENTVNRYHIGYIDSLKYLRIDYLNPEDIITIGSQKYKIYPACRKNLAARDGGASYDGYTGTMGMAIKYDGP